MSNTARNANTVRPIRPDLLLNIDDGLDNVRLAGTKCAACGETSLGTVELCPNCGAGAVTSLPLSNDGVIWSYTVARHSPPGNYRGPQPFQPFGIALVQLPEGVRVLSRMEADVDALHVDMAVTFMPYLRHDDNGDIVVTFAYKPQ